MNQINQALHMADDHRERRLANTYYGDVDMDTVPQEKLCSNCKQSKSLNDFHVHPTTKDRRQPKCKECANAFGRKYRGNNAALVAEKERLRSLTPERQRWKRDWERKNHQRRQARERYLDSLNRADKNAKMRAWRRANPEKAKQYGTVWRERNREYIREKSRIQSKQYNKTHPDKVRASSHRYRQRVRTSSEHFTGDDWAIIKSYFEHRCLCCGKREPDIMLSPDHVIPISKGGSNSRDNIQPLCRKCNRIKSDKDTDYRASQPKFPIVRNAKNESSWH